MLLTLHAEEPELGVVAEAEEAEAEEAAVRSHEKVWRLRSLSIGFRVSEG